MVDLVCTHNFTEKILSLFLEYMTVLQESTKTGEMFVFLKSLHCITLYNIFCSMWENIFNDIT